MENKIKESYKVLVPLYDKNIGDTITPTTKGDKNYLACNYPLEMEIEDWENRLSLCYYSEGRCYGLYNYGCIRRLLEQGVIEKEKIK
ncbi:hypothetical protein NPD5_3867 [Clostridium sporogenes]|uniref:Uncharacterized protein n=1 Tax=Clostridium sporogenes TaxID=1509 RepID=A0A1L3NJ38_CLOSG|nr:hypothetical protein [Clostridium sporogenes]APH16147.1 hypothetical protein NPD5_3867 [Clostridium sporogenes]